MIHILFVACTTLCLRHEPELFMVFTTFVPAMNGVPETAFMAGTRFKQMRFLPSTGLVHGINNRLTPGTD
jgi:hypothetical protein